MRDGHKNRTKIHKPTSKPAGGSPLIVLIYGGGFISGSEEQMTPWARAFVRQFGAVVVNIKYRLAPENKFPTSWHDAWDATKWIAENAKSLDADTSKGFVVGGVSAGGNLTAYLTRQAQDTPLAVPFTGQWLCVPSVMSEANCPEKYKELYLAFKHNTEAPVLYSSALDQIGEHVGADESSPLRYPILGKTPLTGLPPAFIQSDGMDPLRDDALIYDEMLKEAGVKTRCNFYPGCPHAHFAFMPGVRPSNQAVADILQGMGWLLGKDVKLEDVPKAMGMA